MKLGVLINTEIKNGGAFQHGLGTLNLLFQKFKLESDWSICALTSFESNLEFLNKLGIETHLYQKRKTFLKKEVNNLEQIALSAQVQLLYFLGPYDDWEFLKTIPYLFTVNDLCHRYFPEFPEVSSNGESERRDHVYGKGAQKAICTFVDSPISKNDLSRYYSVDLERISIIPFLPAKSVVEFKSDENKSKSILKSHGIKKPYFYYPAQFWTHKNHAYIVRALQKFLMKNDASVDVVFSGFDYGNKQFIKDLAKELGVFDHIKFLDFVENEEIPHLYQQSSGLIMASYFGPTNLPPLEAFCLGIPVLYPDLPQAKSFLGDAAIYVDLNNPDSLSGEMLAVLKGEPRIKEKLEKGKSLVKEIMAIDRWKIISERLRRFALIRSAWK